MKFNEFLGVFLLKWIDDGRHVWNDISGAYTDIVALRDALRWAGTSLCGIFVRITENILTRNQLI